MTRPSGFIPAPLRSLGDLDDHLVAGRGVVAGLGRDVDLIGFAGRVVRPDESETLRRPPKDARRPGPRDPAGERLVLGLFELAIFDQTLDHRPEIRVVVGRNRQPPRHRLERDRLVIGPRDQLQDTVGVIRHLE